MTGLHAINSTLSDAGFGPSLLCTAVGFRTPPADPAATAPEPQRVGLMYLFKRGTLYPFAPAGGQQRDSALEMQIRAALAGELPIEPALERWFPIWNAPVP